MSSPPGQLLRKVKAISQAGIVPCPESEALILTLTLTTRTLAVVHWRPHIDFEEDQTARIPMVGATGAGCVSWSK